MRWQGLSVEEESERRLPKLSADSVVRTFDAPEALGIRFHEIRARSALNKVPKSSRMPFRWTVNPYRGCSHACVYCLSGETPLLMADGHTKPIAEVQVGDAIYGTSRRGSYRRYARTVVLAHWRTYKEAYRITLADGTELVASGDHRFLTDRGWKYVTGAEQGRNRRPHLTLNSKLMGSGAFASGLQHSSDYRQGYLCGVIRGGVIRGDGHIGSYSYEREGRAHGDVHRSIEGTAIKSPAPLGVVSIEPLNRRVEMYDITTGTGDFIANGVVSHNCFARPTHTYLDLNAREDFEREIIVKVNVPELLNAELARPSWKHEHVALGTNTDPYQWVEGRYRLMPGIWKALRDSRTPGSLVTKSPLVLRDVEVLKQLHERSEMTVYMSVPTLDEGAWRETEPHTPSPRARVEAVAKLNEAGVPAGILVAPLMPGVNDSPEQVKEILRLAADAGAISVAGVTLHLRGEVRDIFFDWLRCYRPDLIPHYEEIYKRGAYAGSELRREHSALIDYRRRGGRRRGIVKKREQQKSRDATEPEQSALF